MTSASPRYSSMQWVLELWYAVVKYGLSLPPCKVWSLFLLCLMEILHFPKQDQPKPSTSASWSNQAPLPGRTGLCSNSWRMLWNDPSYGHTQSVSGPFHIIAAGTTLSMTRLVRNSLCNTLWSIWKPTMRRSIHNPSPTNSAQVVWFKGTQSENHQLPTRTKSQEPQPKMFRRRIVLTWHESAGRYSFASSGCGGEPKLAKCCCFAVLIEHPVTGSC